MQKRREDRIRATPPSTVTPGVVLATLPPPAGAASAQLDNPSATLVPNSRQVATVTALCTTVLGNTCAGGIANLSSNACIRDRTVLDFNAASFPTVNVGGTVAMENKRVGQGGRSCPAKLSPELTILDGDLAVKSSGSITGDFGLIPCSITNGGALFIHLTVGPRIRSSLIVAPGGRISSDCLTGAGNGRGRNITVVVEEGRIPMQALLGSSINGPTTRGVISANTRAVFHHAFLVNCGVSEIGRVAAGYGDPANEAIPVEGTAAIVFPAPAVEGAIGDKIFILGNGDAPRVTVPPFPTALPVTLLLPPGDATRVVVGATGLINIDARDSGGGEIHILARFVVVEGSSTSGVGSNGLIQAGGNTHTGTILGREALLPVIIAITATSVGNGSRSGMTRSQAANEVNVDGLARANGSGPFWVGRTIQIEAVNSEITQVTGMLRASDASGLIQLRECLVNAANTPGANPAAAALLALDCGNPNLITPLPVLASGTSCFCLDGFRVRAGTPILKKPISLHPSLL